jgi:hypothetical protein
VIRNCTPRSVDSPQVLRLALLATFVALLAATAASAATPAQYKAKVNGVCRGFTPEFKKLEQNLEQAKGATNQRVAWGALLIIAIAQDKQIEAVPVPAALKATMAPILVRLKLIDVQANAAANAAKTGNTKSMLAHLDKLGALSTPLNKWFDAAGLSYCGSKQQ